jgi:hypothetical protein
VALLYARDELLLLVEQYVGLKLDDGVRTRSRERGCPPVILALGARGAGKTAVHDELAAGYANKAPLVRADISLPQYSEPDPAAALGDAPLLQLLRDLKFELELEVRGNGRISFPRLSVALVAVEAWQAGWSTNTTITLDEARQELKRRRAALARIAHREMGDQVMEKWIRDVVANIGGGAVPHPANAFVIATINAFMDRIMSTRRRIPLDWHKRFDPRLPGDGYDALVMLGRSFRNGGDSRAERALVGAFLADLRAGYGGPAWLSARTASPLVLLDNVAAGSVGDRFLDLVLECRALPDTGDDPLVVVASGPKGYEPARARAAPNGASAPEASRVTGEAVQRMPLTPLTESDVSYMLLGANPNLLPRDMARLIVRLTGGMPLAADAMARAVTLAAPEDGSGARVQSGQLLDLPVPDANNRPGLPVAAYVLRQLIPHDKRRDRLSLFSCARDWDEARKLADTYLPATPAPWYVEVAEEILRKNGWADGNGDYFVSDPVLRRFLLHQRRVSAATPTSAHAHETLRDFHGKNSSGPLRNGEWTRLYHCLSRGDVGYVTRRLGESFGGPNIDDWLTAVVQVAAATCAASPDARRDAALGAQDDPDHDEVQRSVWRLLHAAWYLTDPLVPPDSEVIDELRAELQFLAGKHPHGNWVLGVAARQWPARLKNWQQDWKHTT